MSRPQINVLLLDELAGTSCIIQRRKRRLRINPVDDCSTCEEQGIVHQGNSKQKSAILKLNRRMSNIVTNNNTAPDHYHHYQQHRDHRRCHQNEAQPERCSELMCSSGASLFIHHRTLLCQGVVVEQSRKMRNNYLLTMNGNS